MPTPEKIAFFEAHQKELGILIDQANVRRSALGFLPLEEEEIDKALDELMVSSDIAGYEFPKPRQELAIKRPVKPTPLNSEVQGEKFSFEIIKCANGFLMNMSGQESKTFIFKSKEELSAIFDDVLFCKKKEVVCGSDNGFKRERPEDNRPTIKKRGRPARANPILSGNGNS